MSSGSSNTRRRYNFGESMEIRECECGRQLVIRTSWTDRNPGRRFWHCSESAVSSVFGMKGCGFFDWADPPMCPRAISIIPGLLRRINRDREEIERLKAILDVIAKEKEVKTKRCCKITILFVFGFMLVLQLFSYLCFEPAVSVRMLQGY
nr:zinc finger, GRF-type [Ipomoea batatas]